jgi:hypothetical protein
LKILPLELGEGMAGCNRWTLTEVEDEVTKPACYVVFFSPNREAYQPIIEYKPAFLPLFLPSLASCIFSTAFFSTSGELQPKPNTLEYIGHYCSAPL